MPTSDGVQAFRDPGNARGIVLTDEPDLDAAQASGRWIAAVAPPRAKQ